MFPSVSHDNKRPPQTNRQKKTRIFITYSPNYHHSRYSIDGQRAFMAMYWGKWNKYICVWGRILFSASLNREHSHLETRPQIKLASVEQRKKKLKDNTKKKHRRVYILWCDENSNKGNSTAISVVFLFLCSISEVEIDVRPINVACRGAWKWQYTFQATILDYIKYQARGLYQKL